MKKIYINNFRLSLKALMLVMMTVFFAITANAQFTIAQSPNPGDFHFVNGKDTVLIDTTGTDFSSSTVFYLHYDLPFDDEKIIGSSGDTAIIFNWNYLDGNLEDYYVTNASNLGTNLEVEFDPSSIDLGGTQFYDDGDEEYEMNRVGFRVLTTQAIPELNTTQNASLFVDIDLTDLDEQSGSTDSLVVEYSINGGVDWIPLEDVLDSTYFDARYMAGAANAGITSLEFEVVANAKTANTRFRIRQGTRSNFTLNEDAWYVDATTFIVSIGSESIGSTFAVNNYTVSLPYSQVDATNDTSGVFQSNFFVGHPIEVDAAFTGFEDQNENYDFTTVFTNGDNRFRLSNETIGSITASDNGDGSFTYEFTIEGDLPNDIDYNENWIVSIEAYNGASATLGSSLDLLNDIDVTKIGFDGLADEFNSDNERYLLTEEFAIESLTNATLTLNVEKTSTGQLSPDGTEVVLEYTTNGSDFTQLTALTKTAAGISLNDTLDSDFTYDLSTITGLVSNSVQFRLKQLSNSGAELDTWDVETLLLSTSGTLLDNQDPVDYDMSTLVTINEPSVVVDAIDVPAELIYPGDELILTYNVEQGVFPAGTEFEVIFDSDEDVVYTVGTSLLIGQGEDLDHTVTIVIPQVPEGSYDVYLVSTTGTESNTVAVPVFQNSVSITDVVSNNAATDNGVDIFYPGDDITVSFEFDGNVLTGETLYLEYYDYDTEEYEEITNTILTSDVTGSITGTFPQEVNYDDGGNEGLGSIRLRVGNGQLASSILETAENTEGYEVEDDEVEDDESFFDYFQEDLTVGNNSLNDGDYNTNNFISSGVRSSVTIPVSAPFGGEVYLYFNEVSTSGTPQTVTLSGSIDGGSNYVEIGTEEIFIGEGGVEFDEDIPSSLAGDEVIFKFSYNTIDPVAEFENEIELLEIYIDVNAATDGLFAEEDISDQIRRPRVSLELLDDTDFIVGEEIIVEYTTEGNFPSNTEFALVFAGNLDDNDGISDFDFDDGDDFFTVVATSATEGIGAFTFNVPDMAFEFDGSDSDFDLYDYLTVVAYDATGGADFLPNENIIVDNDDQFLVIEGTDEEDGSYEFDLVGDRTLLTQAFDLSAADQVFLEFTFDDDGEISPSDNVNTIPFLQSSINGGTSFEALPIVDADPVGDGALYDTDSYSIELSSSAITSATHFRWIQALNLGEGENYWSISGITIVLVVGNEILAEYTVGNDEQMISVNHPSIAEYELNRVNTDDAVFNGESVDLSFDPIFETSNEFPSGTIFEYLLYDDNEGDYIIDPETNDPLIIGSATSTGAFAADIPFYVINGTYDVELVASKSGVTEPYYYIGEEGNGDFIGTLDVFLRVLRTDIDFDANDVLYAGSTTTFNITLENDETNALGADDLFATLLVKDFDDGDLVLATQQGIAAITVDLPPYLRGNYDFEVQLSESAALGNVGDIIGEVSDLSNLEDEDGNFINIKSSVAETTISSGKITALAASNPILEFENNFGRGLITSREFEVGELTNTTLISFDLTFDELAADITDSQFLIFEFSTDDGATFTEISNFPDALEEVNTIDQDNFLFDITDVMKANATTFRFRQEERNEITVYIDNFSLLSGEVLPFDYESDNQTIAPQVILVTSLGVEEVCLDDEITISYEVRGKMGVDNIVTVSYDEVNGTSGDDITTEFLSVLSGTGDVVVGLPSDVFGSNDSNKSFRFKLNYDDETYEEEFGVSYSSFSEPLSEGSVEILAPIDIDASFSIPSQLLCDSEEIIVEIDDPQDYFSYELLNSVDGSSLGTLIFDPEVGDTEINIGMISDPIEIEMSITSNSSTGNLTCSTITSNYTDELTVNPDYVLYRSRDYGDTFVVSATGEVEAICEGDDKVQLRAGRISSGSNSVSTTSNVEWFRNDVSTMVESGVTTLDYFEQSGNYFARVTEGACVYLTESIEVTVEEAPDRPVITVVSGNLLDCEGNLQVVLEAPAGFNFYRWSGGSIGGIGTQTVTVEEAGSYSVEVSNTSFGIGCGSSSSIAVAVESVDLPEFEVEDEDGSVLDPGDTRYSCGDFPVYFKENSSNTNTGTVIIYRDAVEFVRTSSSSYDLIESGAYSFDWVSNDQELTCMASIAAFDLTIFDQPTDAPILESTGDLLFCDGEGAVTLTAPTGFDYYDWTGPGLNTEEGFSSSNTIEVTREGTYSVQVGFTAPDLSSCLSPSSNEIVVNSIALPTVPIDNFVTQTDAGCGESAVTFVLTSSVSSNYTYQLIDAVTGLASGSPVTGNVNSSTFITSDPIAEQTLFYLEVSYTDGSGCVNSYPNNGSYDFYGTPNNAVLEIDGATLTATISNYIEIRWYRNGTELRNRRDYEEITVIDNAEYTLEVDFEGGCTVTSNSVDLVTETPENSGGRSNGRFSSSMAPNPADELVFVEIDGDNFGDYQVDIMTMSGQVLISEILNKDVEDYKEAVSISHLEPGIYNVQVFKNNKIENLRLIIK